MVMQELYFVRHGQTLFNVQDKVQGWCDSPLTDEGVEVAKRLGEALKDVHFDALYSSISERAYDTACYIAKDEAYCIQVDKRLKEFNFGILEGDLHESRVLLENRPKDRIALLEEGWCDVGGENLAMVKERAASFMKDIENIDGKILIVSHGLFIAAILYYLDPSCLKAVAKGIKNCSVSKVVKTQDGYHCVSINDTSLFGKG